MNKKLRLLVTANCYNKCPLCCNKQFDMNQIPVVDRWDYDEIMITGGDPMLYPERLENLLESLYWITAEMGRDTKVYLYTSRIEWYRLERYIKKKFIDGIVLAPHSTDDLKFFRKVNFDILQKIRYGYEYDCSFILKVFPETKDALPENLKIWKVKESQWIENCPLPEGEDFRRVANLWRQDTWY